MSRIVTFAFALVLVAGCGSDANRGGADLAAPSGDLSAAVGDLSPGGDLAGTGDGGVAQTSDGGAEGATCQTACDCMPGLGCFGGQCTAAAATVYCCGATTCPSGKLCQSPTGAYGQCGASAGNMPDLAGFDYCKVIHCNSPMDVQQCTRFGCTQCVAGSNGMVCSM